MSSINIGIIMSKTVRSDIINELNLNNNFKIGAICGDICGSIYECNNIKYKLSEKELLNPKCQFTDDTVMTIAIAAGINSALSKINENWLDNSCDEKVIFDEIQNSMRVFGKKYPHAGYGGGFIRWLNSEYPLPYNSWGNGSAMRASYCGWMAKSLKEAERLAEISAKVTHNHPEGIKGAKVTAACIFILKNGGNKNDVKAYASDYYDLNFKLKDIRNDYKFNASCQGTVPYAIVSFLEGKDFSDVISNAISIGGDSDTLAAIAGSIAEAYYPISSKLKSFAISNLDDYLISALHNCNDVL